MRLVCMYMVVERCMLEWESCESINENTEYEPKKKQKTKMLYTNCGSVCIWLENATDRISLTTEQQEKKIFVYNVEWNALWQARISYGWFRSVERTHTERRPHFWLLFVATNVVLLSPLASVATAAGFVVTHLSEALVSCCTMIERWNGKPPYICYYY